MSIGSMTQEKPVALVVEDREEKLRERRELCQTVGIQFIGAKTYWDALREFRATPSIDIVITDVGLDPHDLDDRSGVKLARIISKQRAELPVVGYSGHFTDKDLGEEEQSVFKDFVPKGGLNAKNLFEKFTELRDTALAYRRKRTARAKEDIRIFQESYNYEPPELTILPHEKVLSGNSAPDRDGFLHVVEAGAAVPNEEGTAVTTRVTVPIWIIPEGTCFIAELLGFPSIYAEGDTEDDAMRVVLSLMYGYDQDFRTDPDKPIGPVLSQLRDYLARIFG